MSDHPCELCTRPVGDAKVCVRCRNGLERDLGDVDALTEQLEIVLCRQTAYAERNGPRSSERPLPVDLRASEAAWVLRNTLTTWCRELGIIPSGSNHALSGWLLGRAEQIRHHTDAAACIDEIGSAVAMVRVVIDAPANRTTFPVGPCPESSCPGEIRAYIPADDRPARLQCTVTPEHMFEPYQWMRAGHRILKKRDERKAS
jgi:DNA-binding transcriptional LysR family regulator